METGSLSSAECFNLIVQNKFKQAKNGYLTAYYTQPANCEHLCGAIIGFILVKDSPGLLEFLEKESRVSPYRKMVKAVLQFIKQNHSFMGAPAWSIIHSIGIFLKENFQVPAIKCFFRVCELINPSDAENLAALGEFAVLEGNYRQGLIYYTRAAGITK